MTEQPAPGGFMSRLAGSPCCIPKMPLDEILAAYAELGFVKFEAFTSWCASQLDVAADPAAYRALAERHGMRFGSLHLPPVGEDLDVGPAVRAARFADELGAGVVLFKAASREVYIRSAKPFLDALDAGGIGVAPALQNHTGAPISSLDDFREVLDGIDDPRMKAVLEVGHFQRVGVHWREGAELLAGRIALVHVNDIADGRSVPYGTGEVDFPGLFAHLADTGYGGDVVIELELETRDDDAERTLRCLGEALDYLRTRCPHLPEGRS